MNLNNIDKNKTIETSQSTKSFDHTIKELKSEYTQLEILPAMLDLIIKKVIITNYNELINDLKESDKSIIIEKIKDEINNYLKAQLSNDQILEIFDRYSKKNIKYTKNYKTNLSEFKKVSKFFITLDYFPDLDLYMTIIKQNNNINSILQSIITNNYDLITRGNIDFEFDDCILISFIETYCLINNIKIKQKEKKSTNNISSDDPYSMSALAQYLREVSIYQTLTREEEIVLLNRIKAGDKQAKNILVERNLKLVVSIAKQYRYVSNCLELLDLIQEGNIGLIKAADKYDPNKGAKFSTYATWWIKREINNCINNTSRSIRIPIYVNEKIKENVEAKKKLQTELYREPTLQEIKEKLGITLTEATELYNLQLRVASLNYLIDNEDNYEFGDFIESHLKGPEEESIEKMLSNEIESIIDECNLSPKERYILTHRFGLNNEDILKLEEIGKKIGLTRQRVKKIEDSCLEKLRKYRYIKEYITYLDNPEEALRNLSSLRQKYYKSHSKSKDKSKVKKK